MSTVPTKPRNAFEMMSAAARKPKASTSTNPTSPKKGSGSADSATKSAPVFSKSTFKGSGLGAGPKHTVDINDQPWVEKYRPKNLDEVAAQESTVAVLKKTLESTNLPHMLFYGPPGTGKTSTILALCKQLFGPDLYKSRVLELNASDERGISVVREKIKNFAKIAVSRNDDPNYPAPPYKIIILDEADSMTHDAQSALRRIMENHSRITRFCLICNYVTRIIEPITSRCSKFRFKSLDVSNTRSRLQNICLQERVECDEETLNVLINTSSGDLRRAITYLQSASRLHAAAGTPITALSIQEIGGVVPDAIMAALGVALGVGNDAMELDDALGSAFEKVQKAVETVVREGFSAGQVLTQLHDLLILDPVISARSKATIALTLGEIDKCLTDGADEELQLLSACCRISKAIRLA